MTGRTSALLRDNIDNAIFNLEQVIPDYAAGKLTEPHHPHAIAVLFRRLGASRMLTTGTAEPLWLAQMQAVGAYLHRLPSMPDEHKVTSRAAVFWDAVGGEYWQAAAEIAQHSRSTVNRAWEHEDDFLYVWFLMTRYFLDVAPTDDRTARAQGELRQQALLDRWGKVLAGAADPRRTLCAALLHRDAQIFRAAFDKAADAREALLRKQLDERQLPEEDAAWSLPLWSEGLALLRLAARDGLPVDDHCKGVPQLLRVPNPYAYDPNAWRHLDVQPILRA
jgi:hypothetical protein